MRTERQWAEAMSDLYDNLNSNETPLEKAETQANICGKALKALALEFSRKVFEAKDRRGRTTASSTAAL